jgi:hypothetical protein
MSTDLLGNDLTANEARLLAVYEALKLLCAEDELPPSARPNAAAALALMHNVVNDLALTFEQLTDLGV